MYRSKFEVQRKSTQVQFAYRELQKFETNLFVNNGLDKETGCYPFEIRLITFIIFARSIFQYARKEAKQDQTKLNSYNQYLSSNRVINFFGDLRNDEIHSLSLTTHTTLAFTSHMLNPENSNTSVENDLSIEHKTDEGIITHRIGRRLEINQDLINRLKSDNNKDLIKAINNGEQLFETVDFDGDSDMFSLCRKYFDSIESFIAFGISEGFIT